MKKLSIGFHPYTKRKNPVTNKTQIIMRLILDGRKTETRLPSDYDLSSMDLNRWNKLMQRIDSKDSDINDYLNGIVARRKLLDLELLSKDNNLNPNEVLNKLLARQEVKLEITVFDYVRKYLREEVENSFNGQGTKNNYRNAINQFCIFLKLKDWVKLPLSQFKFDKAHEFKKFLETSLDNLHILGIDKAECIQLYAQAENSDPMILRKKIKTQNSQVSSSTKIKNIKPIFGKAIDEELLIKNPFEKIKLTFEAEFEAHSLTIHQLKRVYNLKNINSGLEYTKDIFLFMCFTGLAYVDVFKLNNSEFEFVNDEVHFIDTKKRSKTGCKIKQILCEQAKIILQKYYSNGQAVNGTRVFPMESLESLNRKLKIIQAIANIQFKLSTKNGRVTFKNLIRECKITDVFLAKRIMGWGTSKAIEFIYDRFTEEDFLSAKATFDDYLNKNLNSCELKQNEIN